LESLEKPVIVIADTHLGLRRKRIPPQSLECEAEVLSGFIDWLVKLERVKTYSLLLASNETNASGHFELKTPGTLIMLGDILELWDSSQRALEMCSRSILDKISALQCNKIYVLGNHDGIMKELAGSSYPWGATSMKMINPTYPEQTNQQMMATLPTGDSAYLFLHGQQFDKLFVATGGLDDTIGFLRDGAIAFGKYSHILVPLFIASLVVTGLSLVPLSYVVPVDLLLAVLSVPCIFISYARPFFNWIHPARYKRRNAIEGFRWWWSGRWRLGGFAKARQMPKQHLNIVYGHTHLADIIDEQDLKSILGNEAPKNLTLVNIPSWVRDSKRQFEDVLRAVFLYIDQNGYEFFGWDWDARPPCPRHISKEDILRRTRGEKATREALRRLSSVGWSAKMIDEWKTPLRLD
jgi:hypothetical protein